MRVSTSFLSLSLVSNVDVSQTQNCKNVLVIKAKTRNPKILSSN